VLSNESCKSFSESIECSFLKSDSPLPPHISDSLKKGLKQSEKGQLITFDEFKKNHFKKK